MEWSKAHVPKYGDQVWSCLPSEHDCPPAIWHVSDNWWAVPLSPPTIWSQIGLLAQEQDTPVHSTNRSKSTSILMIGWLAQELDALIHSMNMSKSCSILMRLLFSFLQGNVSLFFIFLRMEQRSHCPSTVTTKANFVWHWNAESSKSRGKRGKLMFLSNTSLTGNARLFYGWILIFLILPVSFFLIYILVSLIAVEKEQCVCVSPSWGATLMHVCCPSQGWHACNYVAPPKRASHVHAHNAR